MVGSLADLVKDFVVTRFEGVFMPGAAVELLGACVVESMNGDDESRGTEKKKRSYVDCSAYNKFYTNPGTLANGHESQ